MSSCRRSTARSATLVADDRRARRRRPVTARRCAQVRAALDTLEPRDVTILGLHYVEDLTYQEIAETLRITPSRVCQLLWRAVERVRAQLGAVVAKEAA